MASEDYFAPSSVALCSIILYRKGVSYISDEWITELIVKVRKYGQKLQKQAFSSNTKKTFPITMAVK